MKIELLQQDHVVKGAVLPSCVKRMTASFASFHSLPNNALNCGYHVNLPTFFHHA